MKGSSLFRLKRSKRFWRFFINYIYFLPQHIGSNKDSINSQILLIKNITIRHIIVMVKQKIAKRGLSHISDIFVHEEVGNRPTSKGIDNRLRNVAIHQGYPSLSSPSIGQNWNAMVILKQQHLKLNKWSNYTNLKHLYYDAFLNTKIEDQSIEQIEQWQQSKRYPGLNFFISRPKKIRVKYQQAPRQQQKIIQLLDFPARVLLHEFDQIQSIDPLKRAANIQIIDIDQREKYGATIQTLFQDMKNKKNIEEQSKNDLYTRNMEFNKLKRQIIYNISDFYKKR